MRKLRKLLLNLHLYGGLIAGVFLVVLGVTGSIMAFEPEIDQLCHWSLVYVTPQEPTLSLAEIGAAVQNASPGERILGYGVATSPGLSCRVELPGRTVYVNQHTGKVLGSVSGNDGVSVFLGRVHQLHLRLAIRTRRDPGKKIMSWAGVAMLFLLLSGVYLWWPYKRFKILWSGAPLRRWFDIHSTVGIFSFVFLLLLTVTGVVVGFEDMTTPLFHRITGSQPAREPDIVVTPPPGARPITADQALEIARAALPGAAPFAINVPGPAEAYDVRMRYPEDLTPGGRSGVIVDPYAGKVLYAHGSRTAPAGARMVIANRAIHTGDIFGFPSKAIMSLASMLSVVQVMSGVLIWWKRKRRRPPAPAKAG